jgi:hypothetical protein
MERGGGVQNLSATIINTLQYVRADCIKVAIKKRLLTGTMSLFFSARRLSMRKAKSTFLRNKKSTPHEERNKFNFMAMTILQKNKHLKNRRFERTRGSQRDVVYLG